MALFSYYQISVTEKFTILNLYKNKKKPFRPSTLNWLVSELLSPFSLPAGRDGIKMSEFSQQLAGYPKYLNNTQALKIWTHFA